MPNKQVNDFTSDLSPQDTDSVLAQEAAWTTIRYLWSTIKSVLKTYFDTLYASVLTSDQNYVSDAQLIVIGNTSGTNTGDNATNTNSWLVHTIGNETIAWVKTFSDEVRITYWKWIFNDLFTIPALKTEWSFPDTWGSDSTRITPAWSAVTSNMVYSWAVRNGSKWDFYVEWNTTITGTVWASNLSGTNTGDETASRIGTLINGSTDQPTPADTDIFALWISSVLRKLTYANLKASLKTYFDTIYSQVAGSISQVFAVSQLEIWHGTDTTLTRVSAGKTAIEWVNQGTEWILQNSQSAAYTTVLTDAGKHIYHPSADTTARIWTIDSNANVAYPIGTAITFINDASAWVLTISITSDTLLWTTGAGTGSRTLAAASIATAIKITSTKWIISGSTWLT